MRGSLIIVIIFCYSTYTVLNILSNQSGYLLKSICNTNHLSIIHLYSNSIYSLFFNFLFVLSCTHVKKYKGIRTLNSHGKINFHLYIPMTNEFYFIIFCCVTKLLLHFHCRSANQMNEYYSLICIKA